MARESPGSPSQWIATWSPWPDSTCRSTQLYATLSLPPTNHLANGASDQSRTWVHLVSQCSRSACFAQNASRSAFASSYSSGCAFACAANSSEGGNVLLSVYRLSRALPWPGDCVMVRDLLESPDLSGMRVLTVVRASSLPTGSSLKRFRPIWGGWLHGCHCVTRFVWSRHVWRVERAKLRAQRSGQ